MMNGSGSGSAPRFIGGYERLTLEAREPGIYVLTLNRPDKLNAMDLAMWAEIPLACALVSSLEDARVLVITGAGRAFSAGADRSMVSDRKTRDRSWTLPQLVGREADLLSGCEIPIIAAVNGVAAGAGMGIAVASDFRLMAPDAYFIEAHLSIGLTPTVMCWWLPRMIGLSRATDIILTGRRVSADEALAIGLSTQTVLEPQLMDEALSLARRLCEMPPFILRMAKRTIQVAQDSERLTAAREFGSFANRMAQVARTEMDDG